MGQVGGYPSNPYPRVDTLLYTTLGHAMHFTILTHLVAFLNGRIECWSFLVILHFITTRDI